VIQEKKSLQKFYCSYIKPITIKNGNYVRNTIEVDPNILFKICVDIFAI